MAGLGQNPKLVGQPLELTSAELDMAAMVTPVDVAMARQLWQHAAPPALAALLDATVEDPGNGKTK